MSGLVFGDYKILRMTINQYSVTIVSWSNKKVISEAIAWVDLKASTFSNLISTGWEEYCKIIPSRSFTGTKIHSQCSTTDLFFFGYQLEQKHGVSHIDPSLFTIQY